MIQAGIAAGLLQDVGDHRRGRRLAVGPADDDRRLSGDELREERRTRRALDAMRVCRRDDDLPALGRRRLTADVELDSGERAMKIVSWASQPRTSAPSARAMFAYADIPEPPIPTK